VVLPLPFGPASRIRSAHPTVRSNGPSVTLPRATTASRSSTTTAPARGAVARVSRSRHGSRTSSGASASRRSIARSSFAAAEPSRWAPSMRPCLMFLSLSGA